jgi:predicted DCC family thiol-disulfide oxidoreductase YuxK
MRELTVLFDATCALCRDARAWLEREPAYVRLRFIAAGSPTALARYPNISAADARKDITVIDDEGNVYRGAKAWVMCLWATQRYREWALTLVTPALWPSAKRLVHWVSANRSHLAVAGKVLRRLP